MRGWSELELGGNIDAIGPERRKERCSTDTLSRNIH